MAAQMDFMAPPHKHPHIMRVMPFIVIAVIIMLGIWVYTLFSGNFNSSENNAQNTPPVTEDSPYEKIMTQLNNTPVSQASTQIEQQINSQLQKKPSSSATA